MAHQEFNSAVIASAYTGVVIIPQGQTKLYEAVKPLREIIEGLSGIESPDMFSGEQRDVMRVTMETHFPNLQCFEAELQAYYGGAGQDLSREEGWPYIRDLADDVIGDQTLEI